MDENEKNPKTGARQSKSVPDGLPEAAVIRVLDASINRAVEGARVVESFARMVLDDAFLSSQLKQLRHDLVQFTIRIENAVRLTCRDSELDVGRSIQTDAEYERGNFEDLIAANMGRLQQALRTIEEYSKLSYPSVASDVEQLRYRAYTIEKSIFSVARNQQQFANAKLYVLVDACGESSEFGKLRALVSELVESGVDLIQLRDKTLDDSKLVAAGKLIGSLTAGTETRWVMNDRADLCVAANADGVHLGQDDLSVHEARMILRPNQLIGVSTHSLEQAQQAVIDGGDYIGIGPVFPSRTKSFNEHVGVELVARVVKELSIPAFAIGGIDPSNVTQVVEAGCHRVAVSSAVCKSDSSAAVVAELLGLL